MTDTEIAELVKRLEKATGPSAELDALIWYAVWAPPGTWVEESRINGAWCVMRKSGRDGGHDTPCEPPKGAPPQITKFTASIDAALKLVPEGHAWYLRRNVSADGDVIYCNAQVWIFSSPREEPPMPNHNANSDEAHPALSLCIASLKARIHG